MINKFILRQAAFLLGCFLTFYLSRFLGTSSVIIGCGLSLAASFLPAIGSVPKGEFGLLVYCGCFAGMCSDTFLPTPFQMALVCGVGASLYHLLEQRFVGIGGKLGMIAFVSVALVFILSGAV